MDDRGSNCFNIGQSSTRESCDFEKIDNKTCQWLFKTIDKNNDGFIDSNELKDAMNRLMYVNEEDVRAMMKYADKNKDQRLSFPEFQGVIDNIYQVKSKTNSNP